MSELLLLCWEFFKTGLLAVGGGLATLPFLSRMSDAHPTWFTHEMLANMVAVSEATPGPIGVNMATYVGLQVAGIGGALLATLSLVAPSVIVILLISRGLQRYRQSKLVNDAFSALRPCVAGLIAAAAWTLIRATAFPGGQFSPASAVLIALFFIPTQIKKLSKVHPAVYIALGAAIGLIFKL